MKLDTFFEKFDNLADTPNGLKQLRELVLQLAVEGGLVPHSAAEPAVPCVSTEEATPINVSHVPENWRVVLLADAIKNRSGNSKLIKGKLHDAPAAGRFQGFSASGADVWCDDYEHEGAAIIISAVGARCGKAFKASGKWSAIANTNIARPEPTLFDFDFAYLVLNNEHFWVRGGSAQPFVKFPPSLERHLALPPLAEQKRIVAKVDELMALCDRLEAQQQERETRHAALVRASLARFTDAPTPANLQFLFHPSYAIPPADLRKSILTLAVQGKLVHQDPNDEPAQKLVARVASALPDKKSENPFLREIESLITDESEYELPFGWAWLPLGHIGIWATGCGFPMQYQGETDREFLFCKVSDMNLPGNEVVIHTTVHTIDADVMKKIGARANPVGTVIFPKIGGAIATHKRRLVIKPTIIDNNCSGIQPIGLTDDRWLLLFLRNLDLTKYQSGTSVPAVSQGSLDPIRIGLPPLAEQRRIVSKVEQLMSLVDQLETQLAGSDRTGADLLEAVVAELTARA